MEQINPVPGPSQDDFNSLAEQIATLNSNLIKRQSFDVTGTTASTAGLGGMYKATVTIPSVTGTVLGIIVKDCYDTQYFDSNVLYSIYNATTITLWAAVANRGVEVKGNILYV